MVAPRDATRVVIAGIVSRPLHGTIAGSIRASGFRTFEP
jgi:hypothetical protein